MSAPSSETTTFWLPVYTLWQREIVRFYRQRSRIIGALATPIFFWLLIGSGIGTSVRTSSADPTYLHYFFAGTLMMIVLFTAIFSTISIIEDRREGFLQAVLVAPVPRSAVVLGKVLGGASLAWMQGLMFLALGLVFRMVPAGPVGWAGAALVLLVASFALTALGFAIAWSMDSTQGFHSIMNLFLLPMWLLSGALFPASGAFKWVKVLMWLNPLSYGVAALRYSLGTADAAGEIASPGVCVLVSVLFAAAMFGAASASASRGEKRGGT